MGRNASSNQIESRRLNSTNLTPLSIYEISALEKRAVGGVLAEVVNCRWKSRSELEDMLRVGSLRYIIEPSDRSGGSRTLKKVDVRYGKWVKIYNFIMQKLLPEAQIQQVKPVLAKLHRLHKLGMESGRYANDLHVFNSQFLNQDTSRVSIDQRYAKGGAYVVFRMSSDKQRILAGMLRISQEETSKRFVFESIVGHGNTDRHARGTVYDLNGDLTLLGFLKEGQGVEHYTLRTVEADTKDILHGIMTTTGSENRPHSKQCCLVRAKRINAIQISESVFGMAKAWTAVKQELEEEFSSRSNQGPIELRNKFRTLDLRQYISDDVLFFRDTPVSVPKRGDQPPY